MPQVPPGSVNYDGLSWAQGCQNIPEIKIFLTAFASAEEREQGCQSIKEKVE